MRTITALIKNIRDNLAEYYTLLCVVVAVPIVVGYLTSWEWGLFLSFTVQSVIGVLYIRGKR